MVRVDINEKLKGEQLSSVEFIQDYLQLHFDGKYFLIYIWPKIYIDKDNFSYGKKHYRDKLCELIGEIIEEIVIKESEYLKIIFSGRKKYLKLDLDPENPEIASEIAIFTDDGDNSWYIFD